MFAKACKFSALLLVLYFASLFVLARIEVAGRDLLTIATRNPVKPGRTSYTYRRLQEAETYGPVDILFMGSSHCYYSFDPRIFAQHGLRSFNLGTPSQTPLNSYYLLKKYYRLFQPLLVVYEIYRSTFSWSGLESFYDLISSAAFTSELLHMAWAIRSPHAIHNALAAWALSLTGQRKEAKQREMPNERYIPGGYVETHLRLDHPIGKSTIERTLDERQIDYLRRIIRYVQARGDRIILVSAPEPHERLARDVNYQDLARRFKLLAEEAGTVYIDFNNQLPLETSEHFMDTHHLNADGVKIFNRALIDTLQQYEMIFGEPSESLLEQLRPQHPGD